MIELENLDVTHNRAAERFEIVLNDDVAELTYFLAEQNIYFTHTGTPFAYRGQGIAAKLVAAGLAYAREQGLTVVPMCSYVAHYIEQNPDLLKDD